MTARLPILLAALLAGCTCNRDPYEGSLSANVGGAFEGCNEAKLRFLSTKHNVQLVFAPCGANKFSAYRWAPDGLRIYFQLVLSANVMDANAANKRTITLPVPQPAGPPVWLGPRRLALPVIGDDDGTPRLVVHDVPDTTEDAAEGAAVAGQLAMFPLEGATEVIATSASADPTTVLLAVRTDDGPTVWRVDTTDGTTTPAFAWLDQPFSTFTFAPTPQTVVLGHEGEVTLHDAATGEVQGRYPHARRGVLHPEGRYLVLEFDDTPVSVFHQRAWNEVSDRARRREQQRDAAMAERLPPSMQRTVRPPSLSVVDREADTRWTITSYQGDSFRWYPASSTHGSFFLWGLEGKQVKRNVALVDLGPFLEAAAAGESKFGLERFTVPADVPVDDADPGDDQDG